ncbi:MAG TPA: ATP phosphoribosyltransferase [Gemmatimonadaceae bacterium]|nr:ATP phosphoribosyltransferase [Gemmatimonadaceae bacterium]
MLRIAIPNKGRLADDTRQLFDDAGLDVRARGERALSASLGGVFEAIFVRAQDIPEFVADAAADVGITGLDLIEESGRCLTPISDLGFGRCRLAVAATEDSGIRSLADIHPGARVATSFPRATARYFAAATMDVTVVPVSGAAEIAPHLGIADVIVDLVSTGSTLRVNGMREVATILDSSARLVVRADDTGSSPTPTPRRRAIEDLVSALESVIRARGQRYLMAHVRRDRLGEVKRILPGLNGPTVIDIMNGGQFVAVHAVVPAAGIYRTISDLRAVGAEGVLVTRIERLVP